MVDVRSPERAYRIRLSNTPVNLTRSPLARKKKRGITSFVFKWGIVVFVLAAFSVVGFVGWKVISAKDLLLSNGQTIVDNFSASADALKDLRPDEASVRLSENTERLSELRSVFQITPETGILDVLGRVLPQFSQASGLLGNVTSFNINLLRFSNAMHALQRDGFRFFRSDGEALLKLTREAHGIVSRILSDAQSIKNATANLRGAGVYFRDVDRMVGDSYLQHSAELYATERFLGALLTLLESPEERHLLLLFQNPTEIRPGGGFIGSYADLTVKRGQMTALDVRDIYDPDGQLDIKMIPPIPLRTLSPTWGARDANWFFDFPLSAKTVVGFLEASKIYSEKSVTFDAAVGLNINVMESILETVGPIELPEYKLSITKDNFLTEVQREVEAGADKKKGEPKRILKVLTPILLERLQNMSTETERALFASFRDHLANKDIMLYAKDATLAHFFRDSSSDGSVYELPLNFWGSYLAVVDANIAGGKTDRYIAQTTDARIDVDTSGNIFTDLTVTRTHTGNKEKDPWYRALNQNYLQIFTLPGSMLVGMSGNQTKKTVSQLEYPSSTYSVHPDLERTESTLAYLESYKTWRSEQSGKTVFGTWFNTKAGETSTLEMRYETPASGHIPVEVGSIFTFIFEKQSGVNDRIKVTIFAPFGYRWQETDNSFFVFEEGPAPARLIKNLTLTK